jgi:hypothetical protein
LVFLKSNKGQAFSAFEIVIAAIVAIAILFVLLPLISGIITPTRDASASIKDGIQQAKTGSSNETQLFTLKKGDIVSANNLAESTGIDPCSIQFFAGTFTEPTQVKADFAAPTDPTSDASCNSKFEYRSSNPSNAKASIYCSSTRTGLLDLISEGSIGASLITAKNTSAAVSTEFCNSTTATICCVVILKKA